MGLPSLRRRLVMIVGAVVLTACAETQFITHTAKRITKSETTVEPKVNYKVGKPYQIKGTWYYPAEDYNYDETGIASWYGTKFHGRATANGEVFDMNGLSAAHRTLPMPSFVRVTNLESGRSLNLRVNDRGPFARGRIIDLSRRAAQLLGYGTKGTARVRVQILARESRAIATALQGGSAVARLGTPITVGRLPKPAVSRETLPPLPGGTVAPSSSVESSRPRVDGAPRNSVTVSKFELGETSQATVKSTNIFVQAGAYSRFDNANEVRARLSSLGGAKVTSVLIGGRDLYRVRIGPLASVADADQALENVIANGYSDARIIID
ncbi:MAG: septal ring lytic transglycosylase RlpA family protein [Rhodospirillaceae bacterium]|nr:septal ring lytic transglycosylase RlpA family protein [Rhodospirillaceae bacterium]